MTTVLCLVEPDDGRVADVSLRALTFARSLAGPAARPDAPAAGRAAGGADSAGGVVAVVFGPGSVPAGDLSAYGVADAYAVDSPQLGGYAPQAWARALAGLAAELSAGAVVAAGTDHGSEVMAHLGAITGLPVAANCVSAEAAGAGTFRLVRHRWAGSLLEDAVLDGVTGPAHGGG